MKNVWVKINAGSVPTEEDSIQLAHLQDKYDAEFNTNTSRAMWFHCPNANKAFGFARAIVKKFPSLSVTMGQFRN